MKRIFFLLTCLLSLTISFAQSDSCRLRVSLLTCGPGEDLYSIWGHTAVRITDSAAHTDIIYNYGTFDFEDPDFYIKFVKGKLLYFVSVEQYDDFMYEYRVENRSVVEQVLNLNCEEKEHLSDALTTNAKKENRYYFYEFLFDNCATRVRDILKTNVDGPVDVRNILPHPVPTFREMLHVGLDSGGLSWSELGIDLALGSLIDRKPTNDEAMFLPDYLMKGFDSSYTGSKPVVWSKRLILPARPAAVEAEIFSPINTMVCILALIFLLTVLNKKWSRRWLDIFDVALFFLVGGIGCFLLFMWVGTEHDLTADNYNLLWAVPAHLVIAFFMLRNKNWVRKYFLASAILYTLILLFWALIPQGMNPAFLPVVMLLGLRSFVRSRKTASYDGKKY